MILLTVLTYFEILSLQRDWVLSVTVGNWYMWDYYC